jgi:hypothetical protein
MDRIENDAPQNYSFPRNVFTEPLPSNERG